MDSTEFKKSFFSLRKQLFIKALKLLGEASDAEDAVQNLYLRLWERRNELDSLLSPEAYCNRLLRNICIDHWRTHHKIELRQLNENGFEDEDITPFERDDEQEYIRLYLKSLPPVQRKILKMRLDGCSFKDIADMTGVAEVSVRVAVSRLRKQFLKEYFNDK